MRIVVLTLGCPKNEADAQSLKGKLVERGHHIITEVDDADLAIIYTCGFIRDAKEESINEIFKMVNQKKNKNNFKVVAVGCLIQRYYEDFKKEIPEIDGLIGVESSEKIADLISDENYFFYSNNMNSICEFSSRGTLTSHSYIKIGDGCNRNCSFCSIPSFKGISMSRSADDIVNEASFLIENGVKELILVSQDTTQYGLDLKEKSSLSVLLKRLNELNGEFWIRVLYLHPDHVNSELIQTMISLPKVINYFDIPVQSGSNKILSSMKRIKFSGELRKLFEYIRSLSDDAVIRTTIMVGFPGETETTFNETLDFIKCVKFDHLGGFVYSKEENTEAYFMEESMNSERATELLNKLLNIQGEISLNFLDKMVGKEYTVLLEKDEGDIFGRNYALAPDIDNTIFIDSTYFSKEFVKCRITGVFENQLEGELI